MEEYGQQTKRKVSACQRYVQLVPIAQGLLQYQSVTFGKKVWPHFGSWPRTINQNKARSEMVVAQALRACLPQFLVVNYGFRGLEKFIVESTNVSRMPESLYIRLPDFFSILFYAQILKLGYL